MMKSGNLLRVLKVFTMVKTIRRLYSENIKGTKKKYTHKSLADMFNVKPNAIYLVLKNRTYTEV